MVSIKMLNTPNSPVINPLNTKQLSTVSGLKGRMDRVFFAVEMLNSELTKSFDLKSEFYGIVLSTENISKEQLNKESPDITHLSDTATNYSKSYIDVPFYTGVLPSVTAEEIFFLQNEGRKNINSLSPDDVNRLNLVKRKISMYPIFYGNISTGEANKPRPGGICSVQFVDMNNLFYGVFLRMQEDKSVADKVKSQFTSP